CCTTCSAAWAASFFTCLAFGTPKYYTTTSTADGIDHSGGATGGTITATMTTVLPAEGGYAAGELKPGDSVTITFNAIVQ
ncbi:MAG TPA: hypothetical protein VIX18_02880, partial [Nitrospirota bacterium]